LFQYRANKLFWKLHRAARDYWFATSSQSKLREELGADKECDEYLKTKELSNKAFAPTVVINLLPAVAAVMLWLTMK